nr:PREDICTED: uncharacterized protein LOC109037817 [Bemisia tabaci]
MSLRRLLLCLSQILVLFSFSHCGKVLSGFDSLCSNCNRKIITDAWIILDDDLYHLEHTDPCLGIREGDDGPKRERADALCKKLVNRYLQFRKYEIEGQKTSCKGAEYFGCERDTSNETHRCSVQLPPTHGFGSHRKLSWCFDEDFKWYYIRKAKNRAYQNLRDYRTDEFDGTLSPASEIDNGRSTARASSPFRWIVRAESHRSRPDRRIALWCRELPEPNGNNGTLN